MEARLKESDIGKFVTIELKPEKDEVAKSLSASIVRTCGRIKSVDKESFKIELGEVVPHPFLHSPPKTWEIKYTDVQRYTFTY